MIFNGMNDFSKIRGFTGGNNHPYGFCSVDFQTPSNSTWWVFQAFNGLHHRLFGYLATKHLIDCGHKEIGLIAGELDKTTARTRYEGFVKAMNEANLPIHENWIMEGFFEPEDGYECMNKILAQDSLPTAVFCCNDVMALGAISAITEKGLRVPDDISIIGYDNIHSSRFYAPPLTTIHQSKSRLGAQAVNLLFERIANKDNDNHEKHRIAIHPELVIRKSVRNLK